jgi:hypothetical protein
MGTEIGWIARSTPAAGPVSLDFCTMEPNNDTPCRL